MSSLRKRDAGAIGVDPQSDAEKPWPAGHGGLWLVGAALLWGTTGTTRALAPQEIHPLALGAARLVVASAALWVWTIARGWKRRTGWPAGALVFAALGIAAYQATFFIGVMRLGVATGTVIAIGSSPLFAGILGRALRNERLDARWWLATALAIGGVALLSPPASFDPVGVACALGAGLSYAIYATASKPIVEAKGPDAAMAGAFGVATLLSLPLLALPGTASLLTPTGALAIAHLGILATAVAYLLFARGLRHMPVASVATISLLEPATAVTLGVVVLGESLGLAGAAGVALVLAGVAIVALRSEAQGPSV